MSGVSGPPTVAPAAKPAAAAAPAKAVTSPQKYDSAGTNAFYVAGLHTAMPPDAVPVTDAAWQSMLDGQTAGKAIAADGSGHPTLKARDQAPSLRAAARSALRGSDDVIMRFVEAAEPVPASWRTYRSELRAIAAGSSSPAALPTAPTIPANV